MPLHLLFYSKGLLDMPFIVEKMCHSPARLFRIKDRGYIDEGKYADLSIVDPNCLWTVDKSNVLYKCGWSPLESFDFKGKVISTMCNGQWVYKDNKLTDVRSAARLHFNTD